jgi:Uma2 family endonuclease
LPVAGKLKRKMATATPLRISPSEYLRTSYRPDCDYVDGVIEERNLGELDHSAIQEALLEWFRSHRQEWRVRAYPELRVQASPTRFRVADVCVLSASAPREQVIQTPPVAVIEILSPEDRVSRYLDRLEDYRKMGVRNVWVIDPATRRGFDFSSGSWIETVSFADAATGLRLDLAALFASIDDALGDPGTR